MQAFQVKNSSEQEQSGVMAAMVQCCQPQAK
jgi:hypothetical protein